MHVGVCMSVYVQRIERDGKMFYGLRAQEEVFEEYQYLLKVSDTCNTEDVKRSITLATRYNSHPSEV